MSKKGNMAYWDFIDNLSEEYAKQLIKCSESPIKVGNKLVSNDYDAILEIGKEITEFTTRLLTSKYGASFPYIDENY